VTCQVTYTVVQADVDAQQPLVNKATATAKTVSGTATLQASDQARATVKPKPTGVGTGGSIATPPSPIGMIALGAAAVLAIVVIVRRRWHA